MTPEQFQAQFADQIAKTAAYIQDQFPRDAGYKILRFIDGNFQAQGWQGASFQPWKPNKTGTPILLRTGLHLKPSIHQSYGPGEVRTFTNVPWAGIHNLGFSGTVQVGSYTYNTYAAVRLGTGRFNKNGTERQKTVHQKTGSTSVSAHTRTMNMPQRQFMPTSATDSPVLLNAIKKMATLKIMSIFPQSLNNSSV